MSMDPNSLLGLLQKGLASDISEELLVEVMRDLLKDEIKAHLKLKLKENPEIHQNLKEAMALYFEAKIKEYYASLKLAKASGELALETMPPKLSESLNQEILELVEKEITHLLEKSI